MRKTDILIAAILLIGAFAQGQNRQLLYDFNEIPQSLMVNPGVDVDFKWYTGIPLTNISFQAGSSGIAANDVFADDGLDFTEKFTREIIYGMSTADELSGNFQIEYLNVGFRGKNEDNFYSLGIYTEGDAIGYWFRDLAILGFEGNGDNLNQRFDLSDLKTRGELLNVFHIGLNKRISNKLTIGVRAKVYSSIFDFNSTRNKGYFVTNEGVNNFYSSTLDSDMEWRISGLPALRDAERDGTIASTITKRAFFGGNLGLGVDLGFTYNINDQTVFTASLLDLGFINHSNDVKRYSLKGKATVEGVEVILPDALSDPDQDFWDELIDEVEELIPFEESDDSYIMFRPTKLNASLRYNWGEQMATGANCDCGPYASSSNKGTRYANSVGGHLYAVNRPRGPQTALSVFYQRRIGSVLALKTSYTVDKFSFTNIGLGLNLQAGPVNFYVLADNLLGYQNLANSNYQSFQFGLNIISWGKK
ncbi:hypothetical protein JQC67_08135 [Aurantibacter crassamenti]|uniref:DUF5723 family protein n=1 Tax=Aurantibacter crassamenti TaxID=1837375 RepID=UPI0019392C96|nr:DUF5723 family protein [Aurantibacter crassamenti]MBM1106100.1 hypothetical protein [Aurantibacter crassamenti]